jgi:DNA-binding MarR family transcriptional regulator
MVGGMPAVPDPLVDTLLPTLGAVRRTLRRVGGSGVADDTLTAAQREVVLLVGRQPGRPVSEVACELGLAANTVSTIVSRLVALGLVVRTTDPDDRRVGRLSLSAAAQARADAARRARRAVLTEALDALEPAQVEQIRLGVGALAALVAQLDRLDRAPEAQPAGAR